MSDQTGDFPTLQPGPEAPVRIVAGMPPVSISPESAGQILGTSAQPSSTPVEPTISAAMAGVDYIGDYEVLGEIARGGMGVVYRAKQVSLNRNVALKMILAGQLAGREAVDRFRFEAEAIAQLNHPHIILIYEIGEDAGRHFFSMQLLEGGSLAKHIDRYIADPLAACEMLEKISRAVHHAHQHGILHRDLKPANILLDEAGEPHVGDFGLAKLAQSDSQYTQTQQCLGTPSYMAPEQAIGAKGITTVADVYSLGAILYQLLTGVPPFSGESPIEIIRQVIEHEPRSPRSIRASIPRDLETICLKCLRKETNLRYPSAEALADDLRRFRLGEPIQARSVGSIERIWRWCRRKPAMAAAAGTAVVALIATIVTLSVAIVIVSRARTNELAANAQKLATERRATAQLLLESGTSQFASGEAAGGLFTLISGLDKANNAMAADLSQSIRQQLGVWRHFVSTIRCVIDVQAEVICVSASEDGTILATVGVDHRVRLWDGASGSSLRQSTQLGDSVRLASLSSDGQRLLTASEDGSTIEWDIESGRKLAEVPSTGIAVLAVGFSPDGASFATAGQDKTIRLWNAQTGAARLEIHQDGLVNTIDFSPDGRKIAAGTADGTVRVWDLTTGAPAGSTISAGGRVRAVRFVSNLEGDLAVVTARAELWDSVSGKSKGHFIEVPDGTHTLAINRQGILVTGGEDCLARLWDLATATSVGLPIRNSGRITATHLNNNGNSLITGSADGLIRVWNIGRGQTSKFPLRCDGAVQTLLARPATSEVVTGDSSGSLVVWDLSRGCRRIVFPRSASVMATACNSDGSTLLSGGQDGLAYLWNCKTGEKLCPPLLHGTDAWTYLVDLSADGRLALTAGNDGIARLWTTRDGKSIGLAMKHNDDPASHQEAITSASFSPSGSMVLTSCRDGSVRLWDSQTGRSVGHIMHHDETVWAAKFSPRGDFVVTASADKSVRLWDGATGDPLFEPIVHDDEVLQVTINPQSTHMATACRNGSVYIWDLHNVPKAPPKLKHRIKLGGAIGAMAFAPDEELLLTASTDNLSRLWDVRSASPVGPYLSQGQPVGAIAFDSSDKLALTAGTDGLLRLWPYGKEENAVPELTRWAESSTGMTDDGTGTLRWLTVAEWWDRLGRTRSR